MKRSWLNWLAILAMLTMVFAATGCSDDDDDNQKMVDETAFVLAAGDDYFDDYKVEFNGSLIGVNVPPNSFFANYEDYYVVDMRAPADFEYVHVMGARNITLGNLVDEIDTLPTDQIILFMCYSGQTASFATSIVNLIGTQTGHVAVNLKFGASELMPESMVKADGSYDYPTSNAYLLDMVDTASPARGPVTAYPTVSTGKTTAVEVLKARAKAAIATWGSGDCRGSAQWAAEASTADSYIINYFSQANYLDGHLPNAINYEPGDFVTAKFLNTLPTDKTIGVYCYTGQTSAQVAAYLQMLGYDAKTVMYGVQAMAYDDADINDVKWHANDTDYSAIFEGTFDDAM